MNNDTSSNSQSSLAASLMKSGAAEWPEAGSLWNGLVIADRSADGGPYDTSTPDGLTWQYFVQDGKSLVSRLYDSEHLSGAVVIPALLGGNRVTSTQLEAFKSCKFSEVSFDDRGYFTTIEEGTFLSCTNLQKITIPESVAEIKSNAFYGCSSLEQVHFKGKSFDQVEAMDNYPWGIPEDAIHADAPDGKVLYKTSASGKWIEEDAQISGREFYGFTSEKSAVEVVLPEKDANGSKLTGIGKLALSSCNSLTKIEFPSGMTTIGDYAFAYCKSLEDVVIPSNITKIKPYAFRECTSLEHITILPSVAEIGAGTFSNCDLLIDVTFKGKTFDQVIAMTNYPWGIPEDAIHAATPDGKVLYKTISSDSWQEAIANIDDYGRFTGFEERYAVKVILPSRDFSGNDVTCIGDYAFAYYSRLEKVIVPDSITAIGPYAFSHCSNLTSIAVPKSIVAIGNGAFASSELINAIIPSSVASIGSDAFENCSKLVSLTFSEKTFDQIQTMDNYPWGIPEGIIYAAAPAGKVLYKTSASGKWIEEDAQISGKEFRGFIGKEDAVEVILPSKDTSGNALTSIGKNAISNCKKLTKAIIPNGIATIGDYAFAYCKSLEDIVIPSSIVQIKPYAFRECKSLEHITIPPSVAKIGSGTFSNCDLLMDVIFKGKTLAQVEAISNYPWGSSANFIYTDAPDGKVLYKTRDSDGWQEDTAEIDNGVFKGFDYTYEATEVILPSRDADGNSVVCIDDNVFSSHSGLTKAIIPDGVKQIGESSFQACHDLEYVRIPDSIESIGDYAFIGCEKLADDNGFVIVKDTLYGYYNPVPDETIVVPSTVANITDRAFEWTDLTNIVIPSSVARIGDYAFNECHSLTRVIILGSSIGYIGDHVFENCSSLVNVTFKDMTLDQVSEMIHYPWNLPAGFIYTDHLNGTVLYKTSDNGEWREASAMIVDGEFMGFYDASYDTSYDASNAVEAIIPSKDSHGNAVTRIASFAFSSNLLLRRITLPAGITNIGNDTFAQCMYLECIVFKEKTLAQVRAMENYPWGQEDGSMYADAPAEKVLYKTNADPYHWQESDADIADGVFQGFDESGEAIAIITPCKDADGNSVTSIKAYAFKSCSQLMSVMISSKTIDIQRQAFSDCQRLKNLVIVDSMINIGKEAFSNCNSLVSLTIPDSVTTIGDYAFAYCKSLEDVVIPSSVTKIKPYAFRQCQKLKKVTVFSKIESIGLDAFSLCGSLTSIIFKENSLSQVEAMDNYPWGAQEDAVLADIPAGKVLYKDWYDDYWKESDADIAGGVFRGFNEKENAQKVVLPSRDIYGNAVTMISERAFYNCWRLTSIRIPNSIYSIGEAAFDGCSLTSILIPDSITEIGPMAFHSCISFADDNGFVIIRDKLYGGVFDSGLGQDVVIPNNVTGIENCAFAYNSNLTSIIIQSNAAYIGTRAFYECENLIYAEIGDNVQQIGSEAFTNCSKLTDMTIPENVTAIGYNAFADCQELTSVVFGGRTMSEVSSLGDYPWGIPTECIHAVPNGKILYRLADSATAWHEENADIVNGYIKSFPEELKGNVVEIILPNKDANGNKVTGISRAVFKDCNMLYRIIMPTNICSIGAYAFQNCAHLQTFVFPNSIVKIDAYAFRSCTELENVIVPARVAKIGADAFSKCYSIQYAIFKGRTHSEISYMSYYPWGIPEDLIYGDDGNGIGGYPP